MILLAERDEQTNQTNSEIARRMERKIYRSKNIQMDRQMNIHLDR